MRRITTDALRVVVLLLVVAALALIVAYRVPPAGETYGVGTAQHGPVCPAPTSEGSYRE